MQSNCGDMSSRGLRGSWVMNIPSFWHLFRVVFKNKEATWTSRTVVSTWWILITLAQEIMKGHCSWRQIHSLLNHDCGRKSALWTLKYSYRSEWYPVKVHPNKTQILQVHQPSLSQSHFRLTFFCFRKSNQCNRFPSQRIHVVNNTHISICSCGHFPPFM